MKKPLNFWQQIQANRKNRALRKDAITWANKTISAAESDSRKAIERLDGQIAALKRENKEIQTRIATAQATLEKKLTGLGVPNAGAMSKNLEQLTAFVRDGTNFVNAQAYARAVEIAAAHGLRPPVDHAFN